jgi:hypothetical protein
MEPMNKLAALAALILLTPACSRAHQERTGLRERNFSQPRAVPVAAARQPTVDPKSSEAAEDLVRGFAALVNSGHQDDAYMLLGPGAAPRKSFETDLRPLREVHVTVHHAGDPEGTAGSIYMSVPLTLSGTQEGRPVHRSGKAVLRRVNDVPGSTEAQRHWHIERIDWEH